MSSSRKGYYIEGVNGPVITVRGGRSLAMMEMVQVGPEKLTGEVVSVQGDVTTVQVYEDTTGLSPGMAVTATGAPMSITLGPGLLNNIYDGICRPLKAIEAVSGAFIGCGIHVPSLDPDAVWDMTLTVRTGDRLQGGMVYAECDETSVIRHRCMVPPDLSGTITRTEPDGPYHVNDTIAILTDDRGQDHPLTLCQNWPVRTPRPVAARKSILQPLITGQRVIDTLFPVGKGGCAAIPGPFGAGKTVMQHQLAKYSDADIIVYLGCGERGNEMTQVLEEFSELADPRNGQPLMNRTILIANTSNMPVAAREASVYTGMTIAEYYRDMGYHVALMADSTSRWAEALREISGRLEEMPAEEGFPAYLASRLAEFYERAGYMETLSGREGSVTAIGAVSPQGGDFSEPVTQNTRRFIRTFWALDRSLAYSRHFPAINWSSSYSEYVSDLTPWYEEHCGKAFLQLRSRLSVTMQEESSLNEIVKLIGSDILPEDQKLTMEIARVLRLGFLQQNSFHPIDTCVPLEKQMKMLELIFHLYDRATVLINQNIPLSQIRATGIFETLIRVKYEIPNDRPDLFDDYMHKVDAAIDTVQAAYA